METKEYRGFLDKSEWAPGPWQDEPDKIQWADESTGLACLIVRGPHGALCGYVGVPAAHPWHGKNYGQCTAPGCDQRTDDRPWCDHTPEWLLDVHGGITFAAGCSDATRDLWERSMAALPKLEAEARNYPRGDAARRLKVNLPFKDDYEGWRARQQAVTICHLPASGEPDDVWWFGFDCAHSGDHTPAHDLLIREDVYRDLAYVRNEVTRLATQLARRGSELASV